MKTKLLTAAALTLFFSLGTALAQDWGDRYENRLDNRGDRIDQRPDAKGERIWGSELQRNLLISLQTSNFNSDFRRSIGMKKGAAEE